MAELRASDARLAAAVHEQERDRARALADELAEAMYHQANYIFPGGHTPQRNAARAALARFKQERDWGG